MQRSIIWSLGLSGHTGWKWLHDALDSIAHDEKGNGISQGNDDLSVNKNAECESEVTPKWPGLPMQAACNDRCIEIDCHNKYIDNLMCYGDQQMKSRVDRLTDILMNLLEMTRKEKW